jgi:hypothetical protein
MAPLAAGMTSLRTSSHAAKRPSQACLPAEDGRRRWPLPGASLELGSSVRERTGVVGRPAVLAEKGN